MYLFVGAEVRLPPSGRCIEAEPSANPHMRLMNGIKDGATYLELGVQVSMKGPRTQKGPRVISLQKQKLIGFSPQFLERGPFHARKK